MAETKSHPTLWQKNIALPGDHGSWVFLLSPLLIGFFVGGRWSPAGYLLVLAALSAFMLRQPSAMLVKAMSGRRSRKDIPTALFWFGLYALFGVSAVIGLVWQGYAYLLWLALPGALVFGWHLWLVSRRAERRQMGIDILGSGALALAAPAAYWVSVGTPDTEGWWLWGLVWFQTAASIVYAFLRLDQRVLKEMPTRPQQWRMAWRALAYASFNLIASILLAVLGWQGWLEQPVWLWLPFLAQWLEVFWGTTHPAVGAKPTEIGWRQLIVSTLFTILFILIYTI